MKVFSLALFRHGASGYETPNCGTSQGRFFGNFMPWVVRAFLASFGTAYWQLRIHHDDRLDTVPYGPTLRKLHTAGVLKLVDMGVAQTLCGSMLWRLQPLFEPDVELVACRDVDSMPMPRDHIMLAEFERSECIVHAILDSESHTGPLMGGMTAYKADAFRHLFPGRTSVADLLTLGPDINFNSHGSDQIFLNRVVWPRCMGRTMIHQPGEISRYPGAGASRKVAPKTTVLDRVVNHIGAGFDVERCKQALIEFGAVSKLSLVQGCECS